MRSVAALLTAVFAAGLFASGCGYHLTGAAGDIVPPSARSITIKAFRNRTRERGLEVSLQRALEEEFRRRGPLEVVRDDGDVVLSGTIRRFSSTPVAFGATDEAVQFRGLLQLSMKVTERSTGRVLYQNALVQESLDFGAVSGVVITTSPRFQRGTIDARDLINFTNVQIGETRRREALVELLDIVARDVYLQAMEGF
ncbi:MAG: LptE family protein [bacterium]|nr:LptE family protein [bacterium]